MTYPALYNSADELSIDSQRVFYLVLFSHLSALTVAAVISLVNSLEAWLAVLQAMALLIALGCSIFLFSIKPERQWYGARAVAESIKTITWRYVSKIDPYNKSEEDDRKHFLDTLRKLIELNAEVAKKLRKHLGGSQITKKMQAHRELQLKDRVASYVKDRVDDQLSWYNRKSIFNSKMSQRFFMALIAANSFALLSSLLKIYCSTFQYWPVDVFVAIACSLLSWIQAKRYSENATAYALAAQEIGIVKEQAQLIQTEDDFHQYVTDAENAFSREHTQWIAKQS